MKRLNNQPQFVAQESISGRFLMEHGMNNADSIPVIMSMHKREAALTALLSNKGYKTKGLNHSTTFVDADGNFTGRFQTVSSNVVKYRIEKTDIPICHIKANEANETYIDDLNGSTAIGKGKNMFYINIDSNIAGYKDVIILADGETHLHIQNDPEPSSGGTWKAAVKVFSGEYSDTVNPALLKDGMEFQLAYTAHEQDFSERGNERYSFGVTGKAFLSLQRIKFSYSGTAYAMQNNQPGQVGYWTEHKGVKSFISEADYQMTRYASIFHENQILEGKGTVSQELDRCVLTDERGREVLAGTGIMHSGDGAFKFPITSKGFTDAWFHSFMADIDRYVGTDDNGNREVAIMGGTRLRMSFNSFLASKNIKAQVLNLNYKSGENQGIVDTYSFYEFAGIRIYFLDSSYFEHRAGIPLKDGTRTNEWEGFVIPLGNTPSGQRGITLIQLRKSVKGTVSGIDKGGNIASSVDGTHTHMLWQTGVVSINQMFKIYRPWSNKTIHTA